MAEVFISYKQEERERMRPIAEGLRALGVDVWFDERLQPDRSFTEEIHDVMRQCKAQVVCWSPAAMASEWVRGEAEIARQRGVLIALMIEPCELSPPFNMHHTENLAGWSGDAKHPGWRKIVDALGRKLGRLGLADFAAQQAPPQATPVAMQATAPARRRRVNIFVLIGGLIVLLGLVGAGAFLAPKLLDSSVGVAASAIRAVTALADSDWSQAYDDQITAKVLARMHPRQA